MPRRRIRPDPAEWDIYHKVCGNCFQTKPVSEFYRKRASRDGLQNECKSCRTEICYAWVNRNNPKKLEKYFNERANI